MCAVSSSVLSGVGRGAGAANSVLEAAAAAAGAEGEVREGEAEEALLMVTRIFFSASLAACIV